MVIADSEYEGPAIEALGSLFRITQVFLWDDDQEISLSAPRSKSVEADDDNDSSIPDFTCLLQPEDLELTRQMSELGLPLSFHTNKEGSGPTKKGKKKGTKSKHPRTHHNPIDEVLCEGVVEEVVLPTKFYDKTSSSLSCISMLGQNESSYGNVAVEIDMSEYVSDKGDNSGCCAGLANGLSREKDDDDIKEAATNDSQVGDFLISNICADLKIAPALDIGVSAGSHLTGAGVNYGGIENSKRVIESECLEFSPIVCKDIEPETICNDDGAATWQPWAHESELFPMSSEGIGCDRSSVSNDCGEHGDWMVHWDTFYMRRYFYNIKTHTSMWDPPSGMEYLAIGGFTESDDSAALKGTEECAAQGNTKRPGETLIKENLEGKQHDEYSAEIGVADGNLVSAFTTHSEDHSIDYAGECLERNSCNNGVSCCSLSNTLEHIISSHDGCIQLSSEANDTLLENMVTDVNESDSKSDPFITKQEKKVKRKQKQRRFYNDTEEMPEEYSATIEKYWCQRYRLFSRFDDGVKMDEEGWFSVTPEAIARHQASRCASGVIVDCFSGVGGNAIQFSQWCRHVIAIDIDPLKIDYARHNAAIYGVDDQIDFIMGDFFLLAPKLKADTVFLSPPWGGPDYAKLMTYDLKTMLRPHDGSILFSVAREIASRVVMFLPKNINFNQLAELSLSTCPPWSLEVEKVYLNGKLKAITAYFSDTAVEGC